MSGSSPGRAFLGLGSNLGDRLGELERALATLRSSGEVSAVSPVYETVPVGGPPGQGPYLNLVAELMTEATPRALLGVAQRAEAAAGRTRAQRWAARTLDVDVLLVGDLVVDDPDLQVPHPRMWDRGFVLVPLADLAPALVAGRLREDMKAGVVRAGTISPECY